MKIALIGVAGFNRGDDAISECLLRTLLSEGVETVTVTVQRDVQRDEVFRADRIRTLLLARKTVSYHFRLLRLIASADLIVIGGGSIIQDEFGAGWLKGITSIFAEVIFLAKLFRRKVLTAPIGVDDLRTNKGRQIAQYVLRHCEAIVVRDGKSLKNAEHLKEEAQSAYLSADPVFAYPEFKYNKEPDLLVVCPAFEGRGENFLMEAHKRVIEDYLSADAGRRCVILAMDDREFEDAGKGRHLRAMISETLRERVQLQIPASHWDAAKILRSAGVLFAMRLHAVILAVGHTPTFCLSRGTKTAALSAELEVPAVSLSEHLDVETVAGRFSGFLDQISQPDQNAALLEKNRTAKKAMSERYDIFVREFQKLIESCAGFPKKEGAQKLETAE